MKKMYFLVLLLLLTACSTKPQLELEADRVLLRADQLEERPDWVSETIFVKEEGGQFYFIGGAEAPGDSRTNAALKLSDLDAKGKIVSRVESSLTKMVESSESGLSLEDQEFKSLIREVSKINLRNISVKDRYWEKVARSQSDGSEILIIKVFSLIKIKKKEFKKLLSQSSRKHSKSKLGKKLYEEIGGRWQDNWLVTQ